MERILMNKSSQPCAILLLEAKSLILVLVPSIEAILQVGFDLI